jgi:signal transduction histidine kinase
MRDHRTRLIAVLAIHALALVASFVFVVPRVGLYVEDRLFGERVEREVARIALERRRTGDWPSAAPEFTLVPADRAAPAPFTRLVAALPPGVHEVQADDQGREVEYFVGVGTADGQRFAVLHDVAAQEVVHGLRDPLFTTVVAVGLAIALAATVVALVVSRRLFRAIGGLERLARVPGDARAAAELVGDDEIGRVARALTEAYGAQREALERERRFTRNASHELRTPITIVNGALELLSRHPADAATTRSLARIAAATRDMEELVHVFLWLARAPDPNERFEAVDLEDVLDRVLTGLAPAQAARVARSGQGAPIAAPPRVVAVVLRNLVANALAHGGPQPVELVLAGTSCTVANARVASSDRTSESQGFGLSIVADLCGRFGWRLALTPTDERFVASVEFP